MPARQSGCVKHHKIKFLLGHCILEWMKKIYLHVQNYCRLYSTSISNSVMPHRCIMFGFRWKPVASRQPDIPHAVHRRCIVSVSYDWQQAWRTVCAARRWGPAQCRNETAGRCVNDVFVTSWRILLMLICTRIKGFRFKLIDILCCLYAHSNQFDSFDR